MNKQVYIQNEYGDYRGTIFKIPTDIYLLNTFLVSEVGIDESRWKNRLINNEDSELFCNATYLKKEGNTVFLGLFVDPDFDEYPDPNEYKTTVNEFLNMISAWFQLHKERPYKIILEVEGEMIRLYGED